VREFVEWQHAQVDVVEKSASEAASVGRSLVIAALSSARPGHRHRLPHFPLRRGSPRHREGPRACDRARATSTTTSRSRVRDEAAQLLKAISEMQASLKAIVREVHSSAEMVTTASTQIASGNADLSSRTEEQASSIEETAASIEGAHLDRRPERGERARSRPARERRLQDRQPGGEVVNEVVRKMEEIQASSKKISEIIGVIDGIAFQTNILALNAAVEAAGGRAGPRLRGGGERSAQPRAALGLRGERDQGPHHGFRGHGGRGLEARGRSRQDHEEVVHSVQRVSEIIGRSPRPRTSRARASAR
jgi:hypothetical protein